MCSGPSYRPDHLLRSWLSWLSARRPCTLPGCAALLQCNRGTENTGRKAACLAATPGGTQLRFTFATLLLPQHETVPVGGARAMTPCAAPAPDAEDFHKWVPGLPLSRTACERPRRAAPERTRPAQHPPALLREHSSDVRGDYIGPGVDARVAKPFRAPASTAHKRGAANAQVVGAKMLRQGTGPPRERCLMRTHGNQRQRGSAQVACAVLPQRRQRRGHVHKRGHRPAPRAQPAPGAPLRAGATSLPACAQARAG